MNTAFPRHQEPGRSQSREPLFLQPINHPEFILMPRDHLIMNLIHQRLHQPHPQTTGLSLLHQLLRILRFGPESNVAFLFIGDMRFSFHRIRTSLFRAKPVRDPSTLLLVRSPHGADHVASRLDGSVLRFVSPPAFEVPSHGSFRSQRLQTWAKGRFRTSALPDPPRQRASFLNLKEQDRAKGMGQAGSSVKRSNE